MPPLIICLTRKDGHDEWKHFFHLCPQFLNDAIMLSSQAQPS
jgi:hypothetical protein